jgi:hypothetical protein
MTSARRGAGAPVASPDRLVRWGRRVPVARYLGAAALVGVGLDHLWQFSVDSYSAIPTIGTLFALNFAAAPLVALGLVAPLQRLSRRWDRTLSVLLAVGGVGIALGSFAGLEASESTGLFGFMESGYRPAIVLSIALDVAAMVFLIVFLIAGPGNPARIAGPGGPARVEARRP